MSSVVTLQPPQALSSTYFLVATCISVVGVGTIGEEENVFTQATVCAVVRSTTALASASPVTAPVLPFTESTVFTSAPVSIQSSFVLSQSTKAHSASISCLFVLSSSIAPCTSVAVSPLVLSYSTSLAVRELAYRTTIVPVVA